MIVTTSQQGLSTRQDYLLSTEKRQYKQLQHVLREHYLWGRSLFHPSVLNVCLLHPNTASAGIKTFQASHDLGQKQALKEKEQNCLLTACQDQAPGNSSSVNSQSVSEPRGLLLSRCWDLSVKSFYNRHMSTHGQIAAVKVICSVFSSVLFCIRQIQETNTFSNILFCWNWQEAS